MGNIGEHFPGGELQTPEIGFQLPAVFQNPVDLGGQFHEFFLCGENEKLFVSVLL